MAHDPPSQALSIELSRKRDQDATSSTSEYTTHRARATVFIRSYYGLLYRVAATHSSESIVVPPPPSWIPKHVTGHVRTFVPSLPSLLFFIKFSRFNTRLIRRARLQDPNESPSSASFPAAHLNGLRLCKQAIDQPAACMLAPKRLGRYQGRRSSHTTY